MERLELRLANEIGRTAEGPANTEEGKQAIAKLSAEILKVPHIATALRQRWPSEDAPGNSTADANGETQSHAREILAGQRQVRDVSYMSLRVGTASGSAPISGWTKIVLSAPGTISVAGLVADCLDPRLQFTAAARTSCTTTSAALRADTVMHAFHTLSLPMGGSVFVEAAVNRFCPGRPTGSGSCVTLPAGTYYVTIHAGPRAQGLLKGAIATGTTSTPFETAGTQAIDLGPFAASHYDLETILQLDPSNVENDGLGVDATEVWLLDSDFGFIDGDFGLRGPGPAGRIGHVETRGARYAVVRPWSFLGASSPPTIPGTSPIVSLSDFASPRVGPGRVRIVINDWYDRDLDRDGLSDGVEDELSLCRGVRVASVATGVTCNTIAEVAAKTAIMDPRDTDGDGLTDTAEVLGSNGPSWQCPGGLPSCAGVPLDHDQTLPLWGADPRHKDFFVEVDTQPGDNLQTTCPNASNPDGPVMIASTTPSRLGRYNPDIFYRYREIFDKIADAGNPDGSLGVRTHFDVDVGIKTYPGHGRMRIVDPVPSDGYYPPVTRFDMVTVNPQGSTCDTTTGLAPYEGHLGYFRWSVVAADYVLGGHTSECSGSIHAGADGVTFAHETGHHLGLGHGGPLACSPYAAPAGDTVNTAKIPFFSVMSYVYQGKDNIDVGFVKRPAAREPIPDVTGLFKENDPGLGRDMSFLYQDSGGGRSWEFPVQIPPGKTVATSVDFNFDGSFTGTFRGPITGAAKMDGAYNWHSTRVQETNVKSFFATVPGGCDSGSGFANCHYRTMLFAGSPVGVTAAGKLQLVSGGMDSTMGSDFNDRGFLQVSTISELRVSPTGPCTFRNDSCTPPTSPPVAIRLAGGARIELDGPFVAGVAALSSGPVALLWTIGSLTGRGGMNGGGTPVWSAAKLAWAPSGDLTAPLEPMTLPILPLTSDVVDAVATAAFNPATGDASRLFIVVRSKLAAKLFFTTCTPSGCEPFAPLLVGGSSVQTNLRPALTTRRRADGKLDLYLAASHFFVKLGSSPSLLRVFRLGGGTSSSWGEIPIGSSPEPRSGSSLAIAFSNQDDLNESNDRLTISYEAGGIAWFSTTLAGTFNIFHTWDAPPYGLWGISRAYALQKFPGAIPTFFSGDPAIVATKLRGKVRQLGLDPGGNWSTLFFWASGAGESVAGEFEYAEDGTAAWATCAALGNTAAPDLVRREIPFMCPALIPELLLTNVVRPFVYELACPSCIESCPSCVLAKSVETLASNKFWLAKSPPPITNTAILEVLPGPICTNHEPPAPIAVAVLRNTSVSVCPPTGCGPPECGPNDVCFTAPCDREVDICPVVDCIPGQTCPSNCGDTLFCPPCPDEQCSPGGD